MLKNLRDINNKVKISNEFFSSPSLLRGCSRSDPKKRVPKTKINKKNNYIFMILNKADAYSRL
jgi:hypothetical protein